MPSLGSHTRPGTVLLVGVVVVSLLAALVLPVAAIPEEEPNDGIDSANPIRPGETVTGDVPPGDADFFAVDVAAGETINVSTTLGEGDGLKVAIFDPWGNQIGGTRGGEGTIHAGATAPGSGTHYVRIRHWNGDAGTPYEMTVQTYETTDREPNEDVDNATRVDPGEEIRDQRSIGDDDWYAFEAVVGETVNLTANVGAGAGLRFRINAPDGETIFAGSGSNERVFAGGTIQTTGTYYVVVRRNGGATTATYNFTIETYETTDREPNEARANATRLDPPASVEDSIEMTDRDWYAVDVAAGQTISVSGTVGPAAGNEIHIRAPNGTRLNKTQLSDGSYRLQTVARESGTHYLSVNRDSWPGANYTLDVEITGEGSVDGDGADAGGANDGGDGDALPLLPLGVVLALVVVLAGVFLYRRRDEDRSAQR